jgi:hypothetical protein
VAVMRKNLRDDPGVRPWYGVDRSACEAFRTGAQTMRLNVQLSAQISLNFGVKCCEKTLGYTTYTAFRLLARTLLIVSPH